MSFKEKTEFESLEKDIAALQDEKHLLEERLLETLPYEEISRITERIGEIVAQIDEKEMRWLELSERS